MCHERIFSIVGLEIPVIVSLDCLALNQLIFFFTVVGNFVATILQLKLIYSGAQHF